MNNESGSQPFIRHEVRSPAGTEALKHYANAVAVMKRREPNDPTSWVYQAAIHGTYTRPLRELWNQCEHQSWFFLPWHRMYVYYFEQIVRKTVVEAGGPANWALPYWNYCLGGENAALPEQFRTPADSRNPLYVKERVASYNAGARLPDKIIDPKPALDRPNYIGIAEFGGGNGKPREPRFWGYSGLLERTPHNDVHSHIGGWMGDPETAAQDPIFWLHHANIDRLWAVWNERERRKNPVEETWKLHPFWFFDGDGRKVSKQCGGVEATAPLNYTYEPSPATIVEEPVSASPPSPPLPPSDATPPTSEPRFFGATEKQVPLTGAAVEVPVEIDPRGKEAVLRAAAPEEPERLYLNIEDIEGDKNPTTVYAVYLNLPQSPSSEDYERHYLGNLSFFGIEKAGDPAADKQPHGMRASFEVGPLLQSLREENGWDADHLRVLFEPIAPSSSGEADAEPAEAEEHSPIHIGRVSLSVDA